MARNGRGRSYEVRLLRGRVAIAEVDLDVDARRVAERRFGNPGEEQVGGGDGVRFVGSGRRRAIAAATSLLEEGDVAGDVVLCGGGRVDVDLVMVSYCSSHHIMTWVAGLRLGNPTYLALGEEQLDAAARLGVSDGVVLALLVIAQGVEARRGRGRSRGCWWRGTIAGARVRSHLALGVAEGRVGRETSTEERMRGIIMMQFHTRDEGSKDVEAEEIEATSMMVCGGVVRIGAVCM